MNTNIVNYENPKICGVEILVDEHGRYNLNGLHRASGATKSKAPNEWLRTQQAKELISEFESQTGDSRFGHINIIRGGNSPGTFAHELLAVSYAGWISPQFQLEVNQTFLDYRSGKLKAAQAAHPEIPKDYPSSLRALADQYEEKRRITNEKQQLEGYVEEIEPKAEAYNRVASLDGSECVTGVAKVLKMKPRELFEWLDRHNWIHKQKCSHYWYGRQKKIDKGYLTHRVREKRVGRSGYNTTNQVRITPKGMMRIQEIMQTEKQKRGQSHLRLVS